ncbi:MAG TPA: hypothetical protein VKZ53_03875 [Candidatus Angelobacter sp.]|nr:hypothetical protein [Candidatus Angelobacter sp.]
MIKDDAWWVESGGRKFSLNKKKSYLGDHASLGWSPDNRTFYITQSDGYSTGYATNLYRFERERILSLFNVTGTILKNFEKRHRCWDNSPNIAGLAWINNGQQLMVVAEVPPIGMCDQMEYFAAYGIVMSTGRIVARYSPKMLMEQQQAVLGPRLTSNFKYMRPDQKDTLP